MSVSQEQMRKEIMRTLQHEGYISNDPTDKGGITKFGISDLRDRVKDGMIDIDLDGKGDVKVEDLTLEQAIGIYIREYYNKAGCQHYIHDQVRWKVFDIAVNGGTRVAVIILQKALGLKPDGLVGPETIQAANQDDERDLVLSLAREQARRYARIVEKDPTQSKFIVGWISRAFDIGEGLAG